MSEPTSRPVSAGDPIGRGSGEAILVVDDDPGVCAVLIRLLARYGYHATALDSPQRALDRLADPGVPCALVVSDLSMSEMDGLELIRAAHSLRPGLPCLLLTGLGSNVASQSWQGAGAVGLVAKPIRAHEFLMAVRAALDGTAE